MDNDFISLQLGGLPVVTPRLFATYRRMPVLPTSFVTPFPHPQNPYTHPPSNCCGTKTAKNTQKMHFFAPTFFKIELKTHPFHLILSRIDAEKTTHFLRPISIIPARQTHFQNRGHVFWYTFDNLRNLIDGMIDSSAIFAHPK